MGWGLQYAAVGDTADTRFVLAADGAGRRNARRAAERALTETESAILVSTGFCGALDESLNTGQVVMAERVCEEGAAPAPGEGPMVLGVDRVITAAAEKKRLRESTGADIVDMESHELRRVADERGMRFLAVRVVTDGARHDLAIDFNRARDGAGRFGPWRVLGLALARPWTGLPELFRLARVSARASERLGGFLAGCQF